MEPFDCVESSIGLIIEVLSPSSSTKDLKDKLGLYEQAGVPEYWVVDPHDGIARSSKETPFTIGPFRFHFYSYEGNELPHIHVAV